MRYNVYSMYNSMNSLSLHTAPRHCNLALPMWQVHVWEVADASPASQEEVHPAAHVTPNSFDCDMIATSHLAEDRQLNPEHCWSPSATLIVPAVPVGQAQLQK